MTSLNPMLYKDHQGRYADLHANRHTFITNLARAGVSPKTAQTLARHSDIRLTMNVYTHRLDGKGGGRSAAPRALGVSWEYPGSAPESQNGKNGQNVSSDDESEDEEGETEGSPEVVDASEFDATCPPDSADVESTPQRCRTSRRFPRNTAILKRCAQLCAPLTTSPLWSRNWPLFRPSP